MTQRRVPSILDDDYGRARISWLAYAVGEAYRDVLVQGTAEQRQRWRDLLVKNIGATAADLVVEVLTTRAQTLVALSGFRGRVSADSVAKLGKEWRLAIEHAADVFSGKGNHRDMLQYVEKGRTNSLQNAKGRRARESV